MKVRANTKYKQVIIECAKNIIIRYHSGNVKVGTVKDVREACISLGCGIAPDYMCYDGKGKYRVHTCWGSVRFESIEVAEWEDK